MKAKMIVSVALVHALSANAQAPTSGGAPGSSPQEEYRQSLIDHCMGYGFKQGTPELGGCVMQLDLANRQRRAQREDLLLQQYLQDESAREQRSLPLCSQLAPAMRGYLRAQGKCR